ncbi:cyclic nucleotide-binding domain-containing protein [Polycladidibacter stylochi]|uniref:cyclic nucleotide-binding domain-containing protein n=1 Tax=Polycladidibacter stylochi TaxID=1807766 RepID=UPI000AD018F9|nr:cyclic nucleotide-binding domain-containing protein [Pseudovibrio stylochi]
MTIEYEMAALKKVSFFKSLDEKKLKLLAYISECIELSKGETLCLQGDEGDCAFVILQGEIDVNVDDTRVITATTGDILGEIAILCEIPRTATLVAANEAKVLAISKDNFLKLLEEFPGVSFKIMREIAFRLEQTTRELAALKAETKV